MLENASRAEKAPVASESAEAAAADLEEEEEEDGGSNAEPTMTTGVPFFDLIAATDWILASGRGRAALSSWSISRFNLNFLWEL